MLGLRFQHLQEGVDQYNINQNASPHALTKNSFTINSNSKFTTVVCVLANSGTFYISLSFKGDKNLHLGLMSLMYIMQLTPLEQNLSALKQNMISALIQICLQMDTTGIMCSTLSRNLHFLGIPKKPAILKNGSFLWKAQRFLQKAQSTKAQGICAFYGFKGCAAQGFCTVSSIPCTHSPSLKPMTLALYKKCSPCRDGSMHECTG